MIGLSVAGDSVWSMLPGRCLTLRSRMRVVALDLPTSWMMATNAGDEFTARMFEAINGMLLDMLAAVARKSTVTIEIWSAVREKLEYD